MSNKIICKRQTSYPDGFDLRIRNYVFEWQIIGMLSDNNLLKSSVIISSRTHARAHTHTYIAVSAHGYTFICISKHTNLIAMIQRGKNIS